MTYRIANFTEATHVIEALNDRVDQLERDTSEFAHATIQRVEAAAAYDDLEALAGKTSRMLAALAVAIVEMKNKPTRRQRIAAWFREHAYDGTPIFTPHIGQDDRRW